jgi:hypothetical protein
MIISLYSFIMSIIITCILIIATYFLRKNTLFVLRYGIGTILTIYFCCIFRMLVPIEIPGIQVLIEDDKFAPIVFRFLRGDLIWITIPICATLWISVMVYKFYKLIKDYKNLKSNIFSHILSCRKTNYGNIIVSTFVNSPLSIGLRIPYIVLPDVNYSKKDLHFILLHEKTHIEKHHLWVLMLTNIIICIFWWNPFVYLMRKELSQSLEIKCDIAVLSGKSNSRIRSYLSCISSVITSGCSNLHSVNTLEFADSKKENLFQRIEVIAESKTIKHNYSIALITCALLFTFCSYLIIVQPKYESPAFDDGISVVGSDSIYIVEKSDGTYLLYFKGNDTPSVISKEDIDNGIFKDVEIIKE